MKKEEEEEGGRGREEGRERKREGRREGGEMVREEGGRETLQRCGSSALEPHIPLRTYRMPDTIPGTEQNMKFPAHGAHILGGEELAKVQRK